jgi:RNA polymerase sigma-70 factor (ECF subfamily)
LLESLPDVQGDDPPLEDSMIPDERLELIFMCCHPALAREAQVALTLRAVGGLSTDEIARAFLVAPETMKRRLSRARAKISGAGIPFGLPAQERLEDRLAAVLAVVYLIFNEGYSGRGDLAGEAIRLGRLVAQLLPSQPEAHGLLALMLCHDARRQARYAGDELVLLADQDRALWDMDQIDAGREVLRRALAMGGRGPYVLHAAIAVLQTEAEIDWLQVAALYTELAELTRSPVVELNRAVAVAQAGAPEAALRMVEGLPLDEYPYLHSTRADLLRRLGRSDEARRAYRQALERSHAEPERRFLRRRLAELDD